MIKVLPRRIDVTLLGVLIAALSGAEGARAQGNASPSPKNLVMAKKEAKHPDEKKTEDSKGKPQQVGTFGDWGAFVAQGAKDKTCFALAKPKERAPAGLNRDPAYIFISTRPAENVRNEVSIIMGYPMKESGSKAEVAGSTFDLVVKGPNAWIKNQAEETKFVEALKKGSKLVVRAPSVKGNVTTDSYSLAGIAQALEKMQKECP